MKFLVNTKAPFLLLGDVAVFYLSLVLTLVVRYRALVPTDLQTHLPAFTVMAVVWIIMFYIGGMYETRSLKNNAYFNAHFIGLTAIGALLMISLFYFVPAFGIAPKVNLFIFIAIFGVLGYAWRALFNAALKSRSPKNKLLIVGSNRSVEELVTHFKDNSQLGYEVSFWMRDGLQNKTAKELTDIITENGITLIVLPAHAKKNTKWARIIYHTLELGVDVIDLADFYEITFKKVSLPELEEEWLLEKLPAKNLRYQTIKASIETMMAIILLVILSPLMLLAALLIPLTSKGPILYSQKRVGQNRKIFNLYKFRSMYHTKDKNPDADDSAPIWTTTGDDRVTGLGTLLRWSHIDELPQLYNILLGEMSFIGPRPERPEFTKDLEKEIPFYELRYLARPGITGWAQINYRYGASVEDAYEKLQYDIYYLKNRSPLLDIEIYIKTIKKLFIQEK